VKKSFNVDSPSFTPSFLSAASNISANGKKVPGFSPKAANAAPFLPKSAAVSSKLVPDFAVRSAISILTAVILEGADTSTPEWTMDVQDFIPQSYNTTHLVGPNPPPSPPNRLVKLSIVISTLQQHAAIQHFAELPQANGSESGSYETFQNSSNPISAQNSLNSQTPLYQDALSMGGTGFFPSQSGFQQPVSAHSVHKSLQIRAAS
jgi:PAB-dependent poly(A)-specific ribonuclease subunit 3